MNLKTKGKIIYARIMVERILEEDNLIPIVRMSLEAIKETLLEIESEIDP